MPRPDKTPGNPNGTPAQVTTPLGPQTDMTCTICHAKVGGESIALHQIWHEGIEDKIKKAEKTLKREPRMSALSQELNP